MADSTTRYSPRFALPELIERGRTEVLRCAVYRAGQLAAPASGTGAVYKRDGTVLTSQSVTVTGGIAEITLPGSATTSLPYEDGWRVEWLLVMPDGETHRFTNDAMLIRVRLYPVVSDADVARRLRALDLSLPATITSRASHQDAIDEADVELQLRLIAAGRRPWLICTPSALRQAWLYLAIAIELESLAAQNPQYRELAGDWRRRYDEAYTAASVSWDYDQDGVVDSTARTPVQRPGVWLC